jgi:hypothetical protein
VKQVKIDESLLYGLYGLFFALEGEELTSGTREMAKRLKNEIRGKLERMEKREAFTAYKMADRGSDEREARRQEYLELTGTAQEWQTKVEAFEQVNERLE